MDRNPGLWMGIPDYGFRTISEDPGLWIGSQGSENDVAARFAGRGVIGGIVDIVDTVDTADIVHTVDTLDIVTSVNSVDSVGSVQNVQMAHPNMEDAHVAPLNRPDGDFPDTNVIIIIMSKSTGAACFGTKINPNGNLGLGSGSQGLPELK